MTTTRTEALRQSDRVSFRMPLEASWMDTSGIVRRIFAQSLLVSRNGGVLQINEKFFQGQEISLKRPLEGDSVKSVRARIVAEIDREPEGFLYAVHILEPSADFWDIEFPSPHQAGEEALARLLMECGFCQRREVVYLNELELRSFESRSTKLTLPIGSPSMLSARTQDSPSRVMISRQSVPKLEMRISPLPRLPLLRNAPNDAA